MQLLIKANTEALTKITADRGNRRPVLFDSKGLGRPSIFDGDETKFHVWSVKTKNYIVGTFPEIRRALEFAEDTEVEKITLNVVRREFGEDADEIDLIEDVYNIREQIYTVLTQLTDKEAFSITQNVESGMGFECWHRLNRRFDPSTGGRKRNLLSQIMKPTKQKVEQLSAYLESWEDNMRRYEKRCDDAGQRVLLPDDIKMAILESIVPDDLEKHLQMNRLRVKTYVQATEEVGFYVEARTGLGLRQSDVQQARGPDAMDCSSLMKGAKGKSKGKGKKGGGKPGGGKGCSGGVKFDGTCNNCGKYGHQVADCWAAGGGQANAGPRQQGKGAKGKSHGGEKGGKPGVNSVGAQAQATDTNTAVASIDICSLDMTMTAGMCSVSEHPGYEKVKMTLDSGAAVTGFRSSLPSSSPTLRSSENNYRTAGGEILKDEGLKIVAGWIDGCERPGRMQGRVVDIHKAGERRCGLSQRHGHLARRG